MKQLKNQVTIYTGAGAGTGALKTLQFTRNEAKVFEPYSGEADGNSLVGEIRKPRREALFIKGHLTKTEGHEVAVQKQAKSTNIDIVGTVILAAVVLTITILFFFFGNGINIAKPVLR